MKNKNNIPEEEYLSECVKHIDDAVKALIDIPNDVWNHAIGANYMWSENLTSAYQGLKFAKDKMHSYLNFLENNEE